MKKSKKYKFLSFLLAIMMVVSILPTEIFATQPGWPKTPQETYLGQDEDKDKDTSGGGNSNSSGGHEPKGVCIHRNEPATCTDNFRQVAGGNPPPRRKSPPVIGSARQGGWQSQGSVNVVGDGDIILSQNSLQQLSAFQIKA